MKEKIKKSIELIKENLATSINPIIWSSFGKDSIVLIDLINKIDNTVPVLFQKEYICPEKYEHADRFIKKYNLTVYSFPPISTAVQYTDFEGSVEYEVQNYYSLTNGKTFTIPTGIVDNPNSKVCCLKSIYMKPNAHVNYMWDMQFIGHKDCDDDAFYESIKLSDYTYEKEGIPKTVFPLKDWTHEDIWQYIDDHNLDYNRNRYIRTGKSWRGQQKDTTYNPDYFECCLECMKPNRTKVNCPVMQQEINSVSSAIRYATAPRVEYIK